MVLVKIKQEEGVKQTTVYQSNSGTSEIRRCGMIANETTLHQIPNDVEVSHYVCAYA